MDFSVGDSEEYVPDLENISNSSSDTTFSENEVTLEPEIEVEAAEVSVLSKSPKKRRKNQKKPTQWKKRAAVLYHDERKSCQY